MTMLAAILAMVGVEQTNMRPPLVVENNFIEIDVLGAAQRAGLVEMLDLERVILEIEADDVGVRGDSVDALFAAGTEQLQALPTWCIFGLSNFGVGDGSIT